jgi:hypothetical protein
MSEEGEKAQSEFHAHLDECERCRTRPTDLCSTGYVLLVIASGCQSDEPAEPAQKETA